MLPPISSMTSALAPASLLFMSVAYQTLDTPLSNTSPFARAEDLTQLGKILRDVRKAYKIELTHVAADLRLKLEFLEAIEAGNWEKLPGETYGRGYLRQYAEYLKLSPEEATQCCQRIQGKVDSKLEYLDIVSTHENPERATLWLSAFVFIALLSFWGWYRIDSIPVFEQVASITQTAPDMVISRISAAPVKHNVEATCLNIPSRNLAPCFAKGEVQPSFLLKSAATYPIWKASW